MGLIRLLLALSVLSFHLNRPLPYTLFNQVIAVNSFFIISGFYMALILHEKYIKSNGSYWLFITNRFLRIYPIYYVTLLLTITFVIAKYVLHIGTPDNALTHYFFYSQEEHIPLWQQLNFFMRNLTLILTTDYFGVGSKTGGFLIVQQAWTLQLELIFYLLVPFLFRMRKLLVLISCLLYSSIFLIFITQPKLPTYSLTFSFFYYLIFFLTGIGSYFLYKYLQPHLKNTSLPKLLLLIVSLYIVLYQFIPYSNAKKSFDLSTLIYMTLFGLSLPAIFLSTQKSRVDRFLGQLSYPVYITHIFFIKLITNLNITEAWSFTLLVVFTTLAGSTFLIIFLENPLDRIRQRRLQTR